MYDLLLENKLILYCMIAAIFLVVNLIALLLVKYLLPWQGMRVMRKFKIRPKSRRILPLLNLMGQLIVSLSGSVIKGVPIVSDIIPTGTTPSQLLALAASAEAGVKHPLAEAILEWADDKQLSLM